MSGESELLRRRRWEEMILAENLLLRLQNEAEAARVQEHREAEQQQQRDAGTIWVGNTGRWWYQPQSPPPPGATMGGFYTCARCGALGHKDAICTAPNAFVGRMHANRLIAMPPAYVPASSEGAGRVGIPQQYSRRAQQPGGPAVFGGGGGVPQPGAWLQRQQQQEKEQLQQQRQRQLQQQQEEQQRRRQQQL